MRQAFRHLTSISSARNAAAFGSITPMRPDRIALRVPYDAGLVPVLKSIPGHRWHPEDKVWSFPASEERLGQLIHLLRGKNVTIDPALRAEFKLEPQLNSKERSSPVQANAPIIELVRNQLRLKNYSPKTIKSYCSCVRHFGEYASPRRLEEMASEEIRAYLLHLIEEEKYAAASSEKRTETARHLDTGGGSLSVSSYGKSET